MSDKKPQAGEWWEYNGVRIHIVGITTKGLLSCEYKDGTMSVLRQGDHWKHLADCNSFEWQPETFPQYFVRDDNEPFSDCDHLVRTAKTKVHGINVDGSATETVVWSEFHNEHFARGVWKQITQGEAESRVEKLPPMPPETPKPNYVRLWTHRTSGTVCTATGERYLAYPEIWTEIKHDGTGFYLSDDGQ